MSVVYGRALSTLSESGKGSSLDSSIATKLMVVGGICKAEAEEPMGC